MTTTLPLVFREIHRLRKHLRDLQSEIDRLPRVLKAHQAKIQKQEQALHDALEAIKRVKVDIHEKEVSLKATTQQLAKYDKQLNDMTTPKEITGKETEIRNAKALAQKLEEEILASMAGLDERVAAIPDFEKLVKQARAELAAFEGEAKERLARFMREKKLAEEELKKVEVQIPASVKNLFDRLVKAHGADALAEVREKDRACGHCHSTVTAQNINQLLQGHFLSCTSCGRMLYIGE